MDKEVPNYSDSHPQAQLLLCLAGQTWMPGPITAQPIVSPCKALGHAGCSLVATPDPASLILRDA